MRPLIGVSGPQRSGSRAWRFTRFALQRAGARVLRLTPGSTYDADQLDGLVIGGGADIDPERYGEDARLAEKIDQARDELEWELLGHFADDQRPVLGICRGAQLMNIFHGGDLHQDLGDLIPGFRRRRLILPRKRIWILGCTRLARIVSMGEIRVNSLHHQAIRRLGEGFKLAALDQDKVVQGIAHREHPYRIGVQWHPEFLPHSKTQQRLFRELVRTARHQHRAG